MPSTTLSVPIPGVCGVSVLGPVGAEGVSPLLLTFWPSTCLYSLESWLSVVWLPVAWSWAVWASVVWSLRDVMCRRGAWPTWMVKSVALLTGRKEFLFPAGIVVSDELGDEPPPPPPPQAESISADIVHSNWLPPVMQLADDKRDFREGRSSEKKTAEGL